MKAYGGVEGGASHTTALVLTESGIELGRAVGSSTNQWLVGMDGCLTEVIKLVERAKIEAKIEAPLEALGLALSGCDSEEERKALERGINERAPGLARSVVALNDAVSAVYTATPNDGFAVVSGTGSIGLYVDADGAITRCGGYGHMLGDQGSAFWIARTALKYTLMLMDGQGVADLPPEAHAVVWMKAQEYFKVKHYRGLLDFFYRSFDKPFVARFAVQVAQGALSGDELCIRVFSKAGAHLGRLIRAMIPKRGRNSGRMMVTCVGNVFNSFGLLGTSLSETVLAGDTHGISELVLVRLVETSAFGAAYAAALGVGGKLEFDRSAMTQELYYVPLM